VAIGVEVVRFAVFTNEVEAADNLVGVVVDGTDRRSEDNHPGSRLHQHAYLSSEDLRDERIGQRSVTGNIDDGKAED
jgi:hypothetical protein